MNTRLLTPEEVAEHLAVTPKAVRAWLRDGKLPGLRLGRLWRIRPADLDAFIDGPGFTSAQRVSPARNARVSLSPAPKRKAKRVGRTRPAPKPRKRTKARKRRTR